MGLKFEPKSIKEAEEYYKTLHMVPDQKYIIIAIGKLISKFLPIPWTLIKLSTFVKDPCSDLYLIIASAFARPIPGRVVSCSLPAVFILIRPDS